MTDGRARLEAWRRRGGMHPVTRGELFAVDRGAGPAVVVLPAPPASTYLAPVLDHLTDRHRVVAHDHLGLGLSERPADYSYSIVDQATAAVELWQRLGIRRAHLVAHAYGTAVATELLARRRHGEIPVEIASVTLSNGGILPEIARPRRAQKLLARPVVGGMLARLPASGALAQPMRRMFLRQLRGLVAAPDEIDPGELDALWLALSERDGLRPLSAVERYLDERARFGHRWIEPLHALDVPAHILWGDADPIAVPAIARRLAADIPDATLTWLDAGHFPMLEVPGSWAGAVLAWIGAVESRRAPGSL